MYDRRDKNLVLLQQPPASQQCFSLTPLQQQPTATSQPTVFSFHTTSAAASNTSTANRAKNTHSQTNNLIKYISNTHEDVF